MTKKNLQVMQLKAIRAGLANKSIGHVRRATGLSYPTLKRIRSGEVEGFTLATLIKLTKYLENEIK